MDICIEPAVVVRTSELNKTTTFVFLPITVRFRSVAKRNRKSSRIVSLAACNLRVISKFATLMRYLRKEMGTPQLSVYTKLRHELVQVRQILVDVR